MAHRSLQENWSKRAARPADDRLPPRLASPGAPRGPFATMTAIAAVLALPGGALAGPTGGTVVQGSAGISQAGTTTNINQSSNKAIIDWQGFSIAPQETVNFNQPGASAVTLNRVTGNEASVISGALNANGRVFIVNSAGVLFAKGAQVNVGGLVASTLDISNANFMAGNYVFSGNATAAVINRGDIRAAPGGYVALLGKKVANEGVISATLGTVAMASGEKISLNFEGDSLIDVTIGKGTLNALVENKAAIRADGGRVILTARAADAVLSAQVNNSGVIQAQTMAALKGGSGAGAAAPARGSIKLVARGGTVKVAGKLDASAPKGGDGGAIETSGEKVRIADSAVITTKAAAGKSGTWLIDPDGFTIGGRPGLGGQGDISGAKLSAELADTNITLYSTSGSGRDGNINVNDAVAWSADTTLTLNATKNINVNAPITATGANAGLDLNTGKDINVNAAVALTGANAALAMTYGGYATTGSVAAGSDYHINNITTNKDGSLTIGPASVTLSGANASLSINGQSYILIHSIDQLAAISPPVLDSKGNQVLDPDSQLPVFTPATGFYAIGQDLPASGLYKAAVVNTLTGSLTGLGHKISNLTISATTADQYRQYADAALVGTFGAPPSISQLRDIGLVDVNITSGGTAAGLAATSFGIISNAYVTGAITGSQPVGGLVGLNLGSIDNGHTVATISALAGGTNVGGLVGLNIGAISRSTAKVTLTAAGIKIGDGLQASTNIGGLVGLNAGDIRDSHAYINILTDNSWNVGGLVGTNLGGSIVNSTAAGKLGASWDNLQVNGQNYGGLVGDMVDGTVVGSAANVKLDVKALPGTLDGETFGSFIQNVGGLVGNMEGGSVDRSSANGGSVNTSGDVFGVGGGFGQIIFGSVTNTSVSVFVKTEHDYGDVGGFAGSLWDAGATLAGNSWNRDTSGQSKGIGAGSSDGVAGASPGADLANANAAAAQQELQAALQATQAANVIGANTATTAASPPTGAQSAAGRRKTAALEGPKAEDNLTIKEPAAPAPSAGSGGAGSGAAARAHGDEGAPSEEPRRRRHVAAAAPSHPKAKAKGAGFGASIRSIEINGQRYNLEDNSPKATPGPKAQ